MSAPAELVDVVPVRADGVRGLTYILEPQNVERWSQEHAQELLDAGYVRLVVTPHERTAWVGDRRARR